MMEQLRKRLLTWLNVPLPPQENLEDLQSLQDRMDSLERLVMTTLQRPDSPVDAPVTDRELESLPDVHLGAQ